MGSYRVWKCAISFLIVILFQIKGSSAEFKCEGTDGKVKYETGKSYNYDYEADFDGFRYYGGNLMTPSLVTSMRGKLSFTFMSECDIILGVHELVVRGQLNIQGSDAPPEIMHELQESWAKVTYNKGFVQKIEMDPSDSVWSQNIKRAILSMIQNRGLGSDDSSPKPEDSIYGSCETHYEDDFATRVTHLTLCDGGEGSDLVFQGVPYKLPHAKNQQVFGFIRPSIISKCTLTLSGEKILESAVCHEMGESSMGMNMSSKLTFVNVAESVTEKVDVKRLSVQTSILYSYFSHGSTEDASVGDKIKALLNSLKLDETNKAEAFIELKKLLRWVPNMEPYLLPELLEEEHYREVFQNIIVEVGSDEAIRVMSNFFKEGVVDSVTQIRFFSSIAFAPNPGPIALASIASVVENLKQNVFSAQDKSAEESKKLISMSQHILLGASGLAHQFCQRVTNCVGSPEYQELVNQIAEFANFKLFTAPFLGSQQIFLTAIQALGNLDALTLKAVKAVQVILEDAESNAWTDSLALEANRRHPCEANLKESARKVLSNAEKSEPVRISAYISLSRCLVPEDVAAIQTILQDNESGLANFIASHVQSIHDSSSPSKLRLKSHLAAILISEDLQSVKQTQKMSKYLEFSAFNETRNIGMSAMTTLIFKPNNPSEYPQSVDVGLTLDLYGRSYNFLEVGQSECNPYLVEQIRTAGYDKELDRCFWFNAETAMDYYVRVFGTTISPRMDLYKKELETLIFKTMNGDMPTWNIDVIRSMSPLNPEITFPSLMGLPITFELNGAKVDSLKMEFKAGKPVSGFSELVWRFFEPPMDYKLHVHGNPSLFGIWGVSLGANTPIAVGHRFKGKMNAQSAFEIEAASRQETMLDLKINFPNEEIASKTTYKSSFSYLEAFGVMAQNEAQVQKTLMLDSAWRDSGCRESEITGLKDCWEFIINEHYNTYKTNLTKADPSMKGYEALIRLKDKGYEMVLSTPGSTMKRELMFRFAEIKYENSEGVEALMEGTLDAMLIKCHGILNTSKPVSPNPILPVDASLSVDGSLGSMSMEIADFQYAQSIDNRVLYEVQIAQNFFMQGNFSLQEARAHLDALVQIPAIELYIDASGDVQDDNGLIKSDSKVVTSMDKVVVTTTTSSSLDIGKRHFLMNSVTMRENPLTSWKVNVDSKWAQNLDSHNTVIEVLDKDDKPVVTGSLNQVTTLADTFLMNEMSTELELEGKPYAYFQKMKYDWELKSPDLHDIDRYITIENEMRGMRFLSPVDTTTKKEIIFHKMKGKELYGIQDITNVSWGGVTGMFSDMTVQLSLDDRTVTLEGYNKNSAEVRYDISAKISQEELPDKYTTNVTFNVDESLPDSTNTKNIAFGSVNQSFGFHNSMNFEMCESGHVAINPIDWACDWLKEMKLNEDGMRIFQEVKTRQGSSQKLDLLDISIKILHEKKKLMICFKSTNPFSGNDQSGVMKFSFPE